MSIDSAAIPSQAERYGNGDTRAYFQNLLGHYPQGGQARFIETDEVAHYAAYLLSPAAGPITGAAVMLDFGITSGY